MLSVPLPFVEGAITPQLFRLYICACNGRTVSKDKYNGIGNNDYDFTCKYTYHGKYK
jgi:hypothetical protein